MPGKMTQDEVNAFLDSRLDRAEHSAALDRLLVQVLLAGPGEGEATVLGAVCG